MLDELADSPGIVRVNTINFRNLDIVITRNLRIPHINISQLLHLLCCDHVKRSRWRNKMNATITQDSPRAPRAYQSMETAILRWISRD